MSEEEKKAVEAEAPTEETTPEAAAETAETNEQKPEESSETTENAEESAPASEEATEEVAPVEDEEAIAQQEEQAKQQAEEEAMEAEEIGLPELRAGMTIRVHEKIKEGEKERVQVFQGIVTALRGGAPETKTATVQKTSFGVTVEKIFPLASPLIEKIEVVKIAKVRRAKLSFLKEYTKRLKETLVK